MTMPIRTRALHKCFDDTPALAGLDLTIPEGTVTGLVGRNGSGKSTLLRIATGLFLPTGGECRTFDEPTGKLQSDTLRRIGYLDQEAKYLEWLNVSDHLRYVASFYPRWDSALERRLLRELDLDPNTRVGALSPGNRQKLGILLAVCHHPDLLLLDEPASALDPVAREQVLSFLMQLLTDEPRTIVISSHILHDVERLVDRVACLESGHLVSHTSLDELQETYTEWRIRARAGALPTRFNEPFVLNAEIRGTEARLIVRNPDTVRDSFRAAHDVDLSQHNLSLEQIFPWLLKHAA
ncbi:MAG TPA: ABC transporter ATP-binding protein [Gammaproteobacteria bacterium]|nr:ABC transporter ATP-binding protein [Gammaproteobacteria bacterium]